MGTHVPPTCRTGRGRHARSVGGRPRVANRRRVHPRAPALARRVRASGTAGVGAPVLVDGPQTAISTTGPEGPTAERLPRRHGRSRAPDDRLVLRRLAADWTGSERRVPEASSAVLSSAARDWISRRGRGRTVDRSQLHESGDAAARSPPCPQDARSTCMSTQTARPRRPHNPTRGSRSGRLGAVRGSARGARDAGQRAGRVVARLDLSPSAPHRARASRGARAASSRAAMIQPRRASSGRAWTRGRMRGPRSSGRERDAVEGRALPRSFARRRTSTRRTRGRPRAGRRSGSKGPSAPRARGCAAVTANRELHHGSTDLRARGGPARAHEGACHHDALGGSRQGRCAPGFSAPGAVDARDRGAPWSSRRTVASGRSSDDL